LLFISISTSISSISEEFPYSKAIMLRDFKSVFSIINKKIHNVKFYGTYYKNYTKKISIKNIYIILYNIIVNSIYLSEKL